DRREGRAGRGADDLEAGRQRRHAVAVAHPDLVPRARRPDAVEQRAVLLDFKEGAAELTVVAPFHLAAKLRAHGLLAVADAEHRNARLEDDVRRAGAADLDGRGGAAGEDDGLRL